jgi:hypothetical protein
MHDIWELLICFQQDDTPILVLVHRFQICMHESFTSLFSTGPIRNRNPRPRLVAARRLCSRRRSAASDEAATLAPSVTATTYAHAAGCPAVGATSWKLHGGHSHRLVYRNAILEEPRARTLAGTLSAARGSAVARTPWYSNWCVGLWHRDQRGYAQYLGRSSRRRKPLAVHNGCVRHRGWHRHALPRW